MKSTRTIASQLSGEKADFYTTGLNDDSTIALAASELPSSGGKLIFTSGDFFPNSLNFTNQNLTLEGNGYSTRIVPTINTGLTFTNPTNLRIRNLYIDGSNMVSNNKAVNIINPTDVLIEYCWILNCGGFGIFPTVTDGNEWGKVRILNNRLSGIGNNDVIGGGPDSTRTSTGILSETIIKNNYVTQDATQGSGYNVAIDIVGQNKTIIQNNITQGRIVAGGEYIPHFETNISHNTIRPAKGVDYTQLAVLNANTIGKTDQSNYLNIIGNQIYHGQIFAQGDSNHSAYTSKINIADNQIEASTTVVNSEFTWGIDLQYLQNAKCHHNTIRNALRGIYLGSIQGIDIDHNTFESCATPIYDGGGNTAVKIRNNPGYNPVGLSAISVGGSPFTYTAGYSPETVYITGGTVSSITKGGITLFTATEKSINLEPNEAIIVTYSVLPTMNKDIH